MFSRFRYEATVKDRIYWEAEKILIAIAQCKIEEAQRLLTEEVLHRHYKHIVEECSNRRNEEGLYIEGGIDAVYLNQRKQVVEYIMTSKRLRHFRDTAIVKPQTVLEIESHFGFELLKHQVSWQGLTDKFFSEASLVTDNDYYPGHLPWAQEFLFEFADYKENWRDNEWWEAPFMLDMNYLKIRFRAKFKEFLYVQTRILGLIPIPALLTHGSYAGNGRRLEYDVALSLARHRMRKWWKENHATERPPDDEIMDPFDAIPQTPDFDELFDACAKKVGTQVYDVATAGAFGDTGQNYNLFRLQVYDIGREVCAEEPHNKKRRKVG